MNGSFTLSWCFHCWLWASNNRLGEQSNDTQQNTMTKRLAVLLNDDHKHSPHETTSLLKFLFTILYLMTEFLFLNNFAKGWKVSWKVALNSEILPLPWKSKVWRHKVNFQWLQDKNLKIWYTFFELPRTSRKWFVFLFCRSVSNLSKHLC